MSRQTFKATLDKADGNATGFRVPPKVVEALGAGRKPKVNVTLNGRFTYRNTVAVYGDEYLIGVSAERREQAGVKAGDVMTVTLELDTAPRVVEVPADLQKALTADKAANTYFATLSYSNQSRHVLAINDAKTPETRARRIAKSVALFHEGKN
jgi:hypothetical protein